MRSLNAIAIPLVAAAFVAGAPGWARSAPLTIEFDNRSISAGLDTTQVAPGSSLFNATLTSLGGTATAFQNTNLAPDQLTGFGSIDTTSLTDDWAYGQTFFYVGFSVAAPTPFTLSGSITGYLYAYQGGTPSYVNLYTSTGSFVPGPFTPNGSFATSGVLQPGFTNTLLIYLNAAAHSHGGGTFNFTLAVPEPGILPSIALAAIFLAGTTRRSELRRFPRRLRPGARAAR